MQLDTIFNQPNLPRLKKEDQTLVSDSDINLTLSFATVNIVNWYIF